MNDLGITREEARAALRELETGCTEDDATRAFYKIGLPLSWAGVFSQEHLETALAWVSSIGGAVDGKGRPT